MKEVQVPGQRMAKRPESRKLEIDSWILHSSDYKVPLQNKKRSINETTGNWSEMARGSLPETCKDFSKMHSWKRQRLQRTPLREIKGLHAIK